MGSRKTVLITGCSEGGIGDALVHAFNGNGLRVIATARNLSKLQHLADLGIETVQLDVTDDKSIKQAVETVSGLTDGKLHILVNNAGVGGNMPLIDANLDHARKMFAVNVFGIVAVTAAFLPLLRAAKGTLVDIGSCAGVGPVPWGGFYNASKAAANLITDQLRNELAPFDIKVMNVLSGGVKTRFFENIDLSASSLPAESLYAPARMEIEPIMNGKAFPDNMEVDVYAARLVKEILKSSPKKHLFIGSFVWPAWFLALLTAIGWGGAWDFAHTTPPYRVDIVNEKIRAAQNLE